MKDFSPQSLLQVLLRYPGIKDYWLGFSGGLDSTVLLHAMTQIASDLQPSQINAVYIDHGLQAQSQQWAEHCRVFCQQYHIAFHSRSAALALAKGSSLEEAARDARYTLLADYLNKGDALLTAQHKDDQAETFLLQALRGAGPKGLASMPEMKTFAKGWHLRPLLHYSREQLESYARRHGLDWVDDPSNEQMRFQRNYLRHKVMPLLKASWPGVSDALGRSAAHCAEAAHLLEELAATDLDVAACADNTLSRSAMNRFSRPRRANLIRYWLRKTQLPLPDHRHLQQVITQLQSSAPDRNPEISWPGAEIRCYRDKVYAMEPLKAVDENTVYPWRLPQRLALADGELDAYRVAGSGICLPGDAAVEVRYRRGGERCRPAGQPHSRELKTLFQEWAVPPWLRNRVPLIYVNNQLAAVAGYCACQPFAASGAEPGWHIDWVSDYVASKAAQPN